jgi:hypothetical protein
MAITLATRRAPCNSPVQGVQHASLDHAPRLRRGLRAPSRFVAREPPPLRVDWRVRTPSEVARQQSSFAARVVSRG